MQTIKKATLKDNMFLNVEYSEQLKDGVNNVKKDCTAPVHVDLKQAFRRLNVHLGLLCEQTIETGKKAIPFLFNDELDEEYPPEYKFNTENLALALKISCKGFTIGGSGESEGITLIGSRELKDFKYLNLVSPFTKWAEEDGYAYINDLSEIIERCIAEVKAYLFDGKHAPEAQLSLFDEHREEEL